jgi:hypothetical protein
MKSYFNRSIVWFFIALFLYVNICGAEPFKVMADTSENIQDSETDTDNVADSSDSESNTVTNGVAVRKIKENKDFDVKLSYGIDGYAVYDRAFSVSVEITSNKNFNGQVVVAPVFETGYTINAIEYVQDVSLAAGTSNVLEFPMNSSSITGVDVKLQDEDGNTYYEEKDTLSFRYAGSSAVVGVLSDDFNGLTYIDGSNFSLSSFTGVINVLELNEDNFPDDTNELSVINYIIIDNYDTARLSDAQYVSLKDWVDNGGILICGLGANYQNVLHVFQDDFLSGSLDGISKQNITLAVDNSNYGTENVDLKNVDVADFSLADGSVLSFISQNTDIYLKYYGKGSIIMSPFSFEMEPVISSDRRNDILIEIMTAASTSDTADILNGNNYISNYSFSSSSLDCVNKSNGPGTIKYIVVFLIYIIVFGPGMYLLLKKLNKREYIWLEIPVASLLFTVIVLVIGISSKVGKPVVNNVSVMALDGDTVSEDIYANVICPKAKDYTINLDSSCYNLYLARESSWYYSDYSIKTVASVNQSSSGIKLTMHNDETFNENTFAMKRISQNNIGSIDRDLKLYTDGMTGTITNNTIYDFDFLTILTSNNICILDNVKSGESVSIDKSMLDTYGTYSYLYQYFDIYDTNSEGNMGFNLNSEMLQDCSYIMQDGDIYIWGISSDYEADIIDDNSADEYSAGIFWVKGSYDYEDVTGLYYSSISECISVYDGFDRDGYIYYDEAEATYIFDRNAAITELCNLSYNAQPSIYDTSSVYSPVYAYNNDTGGFDEIFTASDTLSGEELKPYLINNTLILKYKGEGNYVPDISAKGDK